MFPNKSPTALYAAFDLYPSTKGAATHIWHFSQAMFDYFDGGMLYVLGHQELPDYQAEGNVIVKRFSDSIPNYLDRAEAFSATLADEIRQQERLKLVHFRDIWGGLACFHQPERTFKTLYEVNGLPSIELPYRYAKMPNSTLEKIRQLELFCLEKADAIVTPSEVIRQNLIKLGVPKNKIQVIQNGATIPDIFAEVEDLPANYILYFGALQKWQGIDVLLKAFTGLADKEDLKLVICSSHHRRASKMYRKWARKLGLEDKIIWKAGLSKEVLNTWIKNAQLTIAPLSECSRNLSQGCCPLKILESLAVGTAVVASDLPVVRELIVNEVHGKLVRPDRPAELSRGIRYLLDFPAKRKKIGKRGKVLIEKSLTWEQSKGDLKKLYEVLINT